MEGISFFGWTGDGNSGGTIGGVGTPYTLAMFTSSNTIGDSIAVQSPTMGGSASVVNALVSSSFAFGRDNIINASVNAVFGYDIQSYIFGDMFFGTTIHVDPAATGDFNYWLGGDFTISGNAHQNIANLYHSSVSNSSSSILNGHFNTYSDITSSYLAGHFSTYSTITNSTLLGNTNIFSTVELFSHIGNNNTVGYITGGGVFGDNNLVGNDPINPLLESYVFGYSNTVSNSNCILIGFGLSTVADNEIQIGRTNSTKQTFRDTNIHWLINGTANENKSGETITTSDGAIPATITLQTIAIPTDTVVMIESYVTCRKTAGTGTGVVGDGNGYIRTVKAQNIAGVVTIGTIQTSFTSEQITTNNATFSVSGTDVLVRITGSADNDFKWNVITDKYSVS